MSPPNDNEPIPFWMVRDLIKDSEARMVQIVQDAERRQEALLVKGITQAIEMNNAVIVQPKHDANIAQLSVLQAGQNGMSTSLAAANSKLNEHETILHRIDGGMTLLKWMGGLAGAAGTIAGILYTIQRLHAG